MEIEDKATSPPPPPPPPAPSSATASPSHDFSFTISFQTLSSPAALKGTATKPPSASSAASDLAPADDIFLHGHLLPLHLLSHPGSPPRASDISLDNFTYPLGHTDSDRHLNYFNPSKAVKEEISRATKPTSAFASFFGLARLRKRNEKEAAEEVPTATTKRKRKGLDVSRLLRKYASLMELLFFFRTGERERRRRDDDLRRRPCSFSGHSNRNNKAAAAAAAAAATQGEWWRRRKGQMSAPASMRTSPTNSGLLSASSMTISSTSTSDSSTMEELQSAIQAAIAHCKNSIAVAAKQKAGET